MKLKKNILTILSIILLVMCIILSCLISIKSNHKNNKGIIIGNKINHEISFDNCDDTFTFDYMSTAYLNKMIDIDASKIIDNKAKKLSNLIKESSYVIINIGGYDLSSVIKEDFNNNSLIYDKEILNRQKDNVVSLLNQIIRKIQSINNKTIIYLMEVKYPYSINDEYASSVYLQLNQSFYNFTKKYKVQQYV